MSGYAGMVGDIVDVFERARRAAARSVNTAMTAAYWLVGRRIVEEEQGGAERAEYRAGLLRRLASDLTEQLGRGFSRQNLQQMRQFYLLWPLQKICQTASGKSEIMVIDQVGPEVGVGGAAGALALPDWVKDGENPPMGLIVCAEQGADEVRYSLESIGDPVLATQYRLALPDERILVGELVRTRTELERRSTRMP
ncbi:MAG: DUF1016 N-terminal domain-containing protein [Propionibacteriaceae bacterium]|nr:DUF1016 N-terminal domain-containing protein [Propionibacteriaceae bacterium]